MQWISYQENMEILPWRKTWLFLLCFQALFSLALLNYPKLIVMQLIVVIAFFCSFRVRRFFAPIVLLSAVLFFYFFTKNWSLSQAFIIFLLFLVASKNLEAFYLRDYQFLFCLSLSLIMIILMNKQDIFHFVACLFLLIGLLKALIYIRVGALPKRQFLFTRIFLTAIPVTILLFLFIPRLPPLFKFNEKNQTVSEQNITGLGEEMDLGDISKLAKSAEIAFRVKFEQGRALISDDLYWRGPVLWHFDGQRWMQDKDKKTVNWQRITNKNAKNSISYELIPVDKNINWLTGLDRVIASKQPLIQSSSYQTKIAGKAEKTYFLSSELGVKSSEKLSSEQRRKALALPKKYPQTKALAQRLRAENGGTDAGFVLGFLNHIRQNKFSYSLEPLPNAGDVETFLFSEQGKVGFCEHYANALAVAARSIDIPARIVTGYQGGEFNEFTNQLIVRQESAHAWTELWIDGHWQRFDPTAAVAPNRIEQGRLSSENLFGEDSRSMMSRLAEQSALASYLRQSIEAGKIFWQEWIINYDPKSKIHLLQEINFWLYFLAFLLLIIVISLLLYFYRKNKTGLKKDKLQFVLEKTLQKLAKQGWQKKDYQSVDDFFFALAQSFSADNAKRMQCLEIVQFYRLQRYQEKSSPEQEKRLLFLLKNLRFKEK